MLYKRIECQKCSSKGRMAMFDSYEGEWNYYTCSLCCGTGFVHVPACDGEHHEWVTDAEPEEDGWWCVPKGRRGTFKLVEADVFCRNCGVTPGETP